MATAIEIIHPPTDIHEGECLLGPPYQSSVLFERYEGSVCFNPPLILERYVEVCVFVYNLYDCV